MVRNAQTKNSIWNLDACEKETALQFNKNGKHGKLWFWVSCRAVFFGLEKNEKSCIFCPWRELQKNNQKCTWKSLFPGANFTKSRVKIKLLHARKNRKYPFQKDSVMTKLRKKNNLEAVFFTSQKFGKVPTAREEILLP